MAAENAFPPLWIPEGGATFRPEEWEDVSGTSFATQVLAEVANQHSLDFNLASAEDKDRKKEDDSHGTCTPSDLLHAECK